MSTHDPARRNMSCF